MFLDELTTPIPLDPEVVQATKDFHAQKNDNHPQILNDMAKIRLDDKLQERGWTRISAGHFSRVYKNPSKPYVMKINTKYDRGYAWFVLLTKKFPNPHFPNVSTARLYKFNGHKFYIYLMEPLRTFVPAAYPPLFTSCLSRVAAHPDLTVEQAVDATMYGMYKPYGPRITKMLNSMPELVNAAKVLGANSKNYFIDINEENVMKRENGTLVITDPFGG